MPVQRLKARIADVGGIPIARLLPSRGKQPIGAWCFLDHAGPAEFSEHEAGLQVGRHPHTNLQTFTWMLEGEVMHHDSIGNEQVIRKNQVNLMTAGTGPNQGISHTEQSVFPDTGGSADAERGLHAVQLWIALPMDKEIERSFHHYAELPTWSENGVNFTLTTGTYTTANGSGYIAPTLQYSPLVGIDMHFLRDAKSTLNLQSNFEYGILIVEGELYFAGEHYVQDELIRFADCDMADAAAVTIEAVAGTRLMFLGGKPLKHKILLWWNFVDSTKAGIEQSIIDWNSHHERFGDVPVDMSRLEAPPLPEGFKEN